MHEFKNHKKTTIALGCIGVGIVVVVAFISELLFKS
jgi:hypothetical protein